MLQSEPRSARAPVWASSLSLAATREITVVFFSSGYLDVSVPRVPPVKLWIHLTVHEGFSCGFPHSDIRGSKGVCPSPRLFAAYRVFLRLPVPRHPPCALLCLTMIWRMYIQSRVYMHKSGFRLFVLTAQKHLCFLHPFLVLVLCLQCSLYCHVRLL